MVGDLFEDLFEVVSLLVRPLRYSVSRCCFVFTRE